MKGTIFVELMNLVERTLGLDAVDQVIEKCGDALSTEGAYTSVGNYPHQELLVLVGAVSELAPEHADGLLDLFAESLMTTFERMHPEFFNPQQDYLDFLASVETHIHEEVLKLYPDAKPPQVAANRVSPTQLDLNYKSHRPLAPFSISLAKAAGKYFAKRVEISVNSASEDQRECHFTVTVLGDEA